MNFAEWYFLDKARYCEEKAFQFKEMDVPHMVKEYDKEAKRSFKASQAGKQYKCQAVNDSCSWKPCILHIKNGLCPFNYEYEIE